MSQINLLVNRFLASYLVTGSVTWLYFSDRLMEFPLAVFGIALGTVILPSLARRHQSASTEAFSALMDWALRWVCVIAVPASLGLIVLARPILVTLFQYRAFNALDVEMTAQALMAFAFGLLGFVLVKILAPGFYARQDTATPAKIAMVAFGANIVLSLSLVYPLKHVGLALSISLAAFINAGLLYWRLRQADIYRPLTGWGKFLIRLAFASALMTLALWWLKPEFTVWLQAGAWVRILRLSFLVITGILIYGVALFLVGLKPRVLLLSKPNSQA